MEKANVFRVGETYTHEEVYRGLKVGNAGGIRPCIGDDDEIRRLVVMTSEPSARILRENPYHDRVEGNVLVYTAAGREGQQAFSGGITGNGYTDTGVTNGTTYYYIVTSANDASEGANSIEVGARPSALISEQEKRSPQISIVSGNANVTQKSSVIGHTYQLQYRDDLTIGTWQNYGPAQPGSGADLILTMPADTSSFGKRFYRVFIQQ